MAYKRLDELFNNDKKYNWLYEMKTFMRTIFGNSKRKQSKVFYKIPCQFSHKFFLSCEIIDYNNWL